MKKKIYNTSAICLAALGSMAISHVATANKLYAMDETVVQPQAPDHSQQVYQDSSSVISRLKDVSKQKIAKTTCFAIGGVSLAAGLLAVGLCASVIAWITGGCFIALGAILLVSGICIKDPASTSGSIVIKPGQPVTSGTMEDLINNAQYPSVIDSVTDAALETIINNAALDDVFKCTKAAVESGNIILLHRLVRNPKVVLSMTTNADETDPLKKTALGLAVQKCIDADAKKAAVYVSMVRELLVREMNAKKLDVPEGVLHKEALAQNADIIVANVDSIASKVASTDAKFQCDIVKESITELFAKDNGIYKAQKWFSRIATGQEELTKDTYQHFYGLKNEKGETALMVNLAASAANYREANFKILRNEEAEIGYKEEGNQMLWMHIANDQSNICHAYISKVSSSSSRSRSRSVFSARSSESDALSSLLHKILELQCRKYIEDPKNPKKNIVQEISVLAAGDKDGRTFLLNILQAMSEATESKEALQAIFEKVVWRDFRKQQESVDDSQSSVSKKRLRRKAVQKATGAHVNDHDQMASGHVDNDGNGLITTYISTASVSEVLDKELMRLCIFAPGELDIGTTEQVCGREKQCKLALQALLERGQKIAVADTDFASYVVMLYEKQVDSLKVENAEGNLLTGKAAYDHLLSKCNDQVKYKAHITSENIEKFTAQLNHDFAATELDYNAWLTGIGSKEEVSKVFQHYINKEGKTFVTHFYAKCLKELQDFKGSESEKQSKFTSMTLQFAAFLKKAKTETEPNDLQGETVLMLAIKDFLSGDEQAQAFAEKVIFLDAETANENLYMQPDTLEARNFEGQNSMDLLIEHGVPVLQELQSVLQQTRAQKTKAQKKMSAEYKRAYARYHKILKCAYKLNESLNSKRQDIYNQYPLTLAIQKKCPPLAAIFVSKDGEGAAATQAKAVLKKAVELDIGKDLSTEQASLLWKCALGLGVNGSDYTEPELAAAKERVESLDKQLTEEEESKWRQLVANDEIRDADVNVIAQNASYYGGSIDNNHKTAIQYAIENYFGSDHTQDLKLIQALLISPEERLQNIEGQSVVEYIIEKGAANEQNKDADTKNLLALFSPDLAAAGIIREKYSSKLPETIQLFTEEAQEFIQSIDKIDSSTAVTGFESSKFPSVRSASGDTALMKAAAVCNDTIVTARVSVEQGQRSYAGLTAMMYAATSEKDAQSMPKAVTIIGQLYDGEKGIVSHEGKTALMYAINNSELNGSDIYNATIIDALLKGEELAAGNALLEAVMLCGEKDSTLSQKPNRATLVKQIIEKLATQKTSETAWTQTIRDKQATEAVKKLKELVVSGHALHGSLSDIETALRAIGNVEAQSISYEAKSISYENVQVADSIATQHELPVEEEALEEEKPAAEMPAEKEALEDEGANEDLKEDMTLLV